MPQHADPTARQENKSVAQQEPLKESVGPVLMPFEDNRFSTANQNSIQRLINNSAQVAQLQSYQDLINGSSQVNGGMEIQQLINDSADKTDPRQMRARSDLAGRSVVAQRAGEGPSSGGKFVAESNPQQGQIDKAGFLEKLRSEVFLAADAMLAEIDQSAAQCPYLIKWFTYYWSKDAQHIEQAIARFATEANSAETIDAYLNAIVARVKAGLRNHIDTGTVADVPPEIMDDKPQPGDFQHIAERNQPVAQLSCLWKGRGGGSGNRKYDQMDRASSSDVPLSRPKQKWHWLTQGQSAFGQAGDGVQNLGTTSCGLVIAFGSDQIGMYHWPFLFNDSGFQTTFTEVVRTVGTLNRIEIITNEYNHSKETESSYFRTVRWIRSNFGVTTVYYVHPGEIRGIDPRGTLQANHFQSDNPVEERNVP